MINDQRIWVLTKVLRDALDGRDGWRAEARRVLGLVKMLECEVCGSEFESGGKLKKRCHACVGIKKKDTWPSTEAEKRVAKIERYEGNRR